MYTAKIVCTDDRLFQALKPEETKGERFEIKVKKIDGGMNITITAKDATALKAMMISIARLLETAEKINKNG